MATIRNANVLFKSISRYVQEDIEDALRNSKHSM